MRHVPSIADVVIIGGGIIGVTIAYYLAKRGVRKVLLLEKGILGEGTTGKCVGGIRTQFSTQINIQFSQMSLEVFEGFQAEFGVDPEFHRVGYLFLAAQEHHWAILQANAQLIQAMGLDVELLHPKDIQRRWPFLRVNDLIGGSFSEHDGYMGPYEVLQGFAKGARRMGAVIIEGIEVTGIIVKKGRVEGVNTATGERVATPLVINAAGPYAAQVAAMVGLELPVHPLRRQIFFTDTFEELPPVFPMIIDLEHGWYMRREGKGLLLAGPQDSKSSYNDGIDFEGREWAAAHSLYRVPILERAKIVRGWAGLYEISPDHHAIIGSFPDTEGFVCANGFSGHGFQHSPSVGIVVSELIVEGKAKTLDIYPLRPLRFQEGDLIHEPLTAFRD
jgi:sarcosine oxidase subunit beta